jgi:flagellar hook-associated protein 1 FlgK
MSLNIALQYAVSGLTATQAQLQVLSGNIANAQTPGYARESLPQISDSTTSGGAGVTTGDIQRATDRILQASVLQQTSTSSAATTLNSYSTQIQTLLGQVGAGNTLADSYNSFTSAMQTLATTPQDPMAQLGAVNAGQQLAQKLNNQSAGIQSLRQSADSQIAADVGTLNNTLDTIGQLNGQISQLQALGQSTATLQDQRDQAISQVSQLIGITTYARPDGTVEVLTTQGKTLVDAANVRHFSFTQAGTVTAGTPLSALTLDGMNVTSETTSGEIGGLLQMRDTTLPALTAQLNQFTNNLFAQTSAANLQTTNSGLGATNDANHFFANVNIAGGLDNSATIQVNPSLVSTPSLLNTNAGAPDPSISQTLLTNLQSPASFAAAGGLGAISTQLGSYVGQIIGAAATAAAAASSTSTDQSSLLTQMQSQYSSETGVNLDSELSTLIVYQNAYSASARVISTIQTMYAALMNA